MNDTLSTEEPPTTPSGEQVDSTRLLAYERLDAAAIAAAIRCREGESVIVRSAFRWLRDGSVIPNGYEMFEMEQICEERGWQIVERYGDHIAIISEANDEMTSPHPTPKDHE